MANGDKPSDSSSDFLWLLLKHSAKKVRLHPRTGHVGCSDGTEFLQSYDWDAIAEACESTKGACSKRYSRMKLALEAEDAASGTTKSSPVTPSKSPALASESNAEGTPTPTPKRKRAAVKKVVGDDEDEDEAGTPTKRARTTPKAKPRPKKGFRAGDEMEGKAQVVVKKEPVEEEEEEEV